MDKIKDYRFKISLNDHHYTFLFMNEWDLRESDFIKRNIYTALRKFHKDMFNHSDELIKKEQALAELLFRYPHLRIEFETILNKNED